MNRIFLHFILLILIIPQCIIAQTIIKGEVRDLENNGFLENVNIKNIYTLKGMTIQKDGQFHIEVRKGRQNPTATNKCSILNNCSRSSNKKKQTITWSRWKYNLYSVTIFFNKETCPKW